MSLPRAEASPSETDVPPRAEPIRVLYVDYSVGFGGATKSLSLVSRGLNGVQRFVLTCQRDDIVADWYDGATVFHFRRWLNYRTIGTAKTWARRLMPLPTLGAFAQKALGMLDVAAGLVHSVRIVGIIKRHGIEIVHLNNAFTPFEAMLAARITGVPLIVHLRGFPSWHKGGRGGRFRRVARTIAVSHAVGSALAFTVIPPDRIVTIYDPVDTDRFAEAAGRRDATRAAWGIEPGEIAVGIFGRVVDWKGHLEFVSAALEAMEDVPQIKAVIVGDQSDGGAEYFDAVKQRIRESAFADRFVLTGYQPRVAELYHAMDIIVHGSTQPEPFGMVVPEGMAARRPVIATGAGGPREVVTPGVDGLLVPPRDVRAMAHAIVALARDPDRRRAMGERGYAKVEARFRIPHIALEVMSVYRELLR